MLIYLIIFILTIYFTLITTISSNNTIYVKSSSILLVSKVKNKKVLIFFNFANCNYITVIVEYNVLDTCEQRFAFLVTRMTEITGALHLLAVRKNNRFFRDNTRRYNWLVHRNRFIGIASQNSTIHPERWSMLDKCWSTITSLFRVITDP